MYNYQLHRQLNNVLKDYPGIDIAGKDNLFYTRFVANLSSIHDLYMELYSHHKKSKEAFTKLIHIIITACGNRSDALKKRDAEKLEKGNWFLSNQIAGMSLYVDRFCGSIPNLADRLDYFEKLGVNLLHLMPVFQSPEGESDGGYAVSDFRKVDKRFGSLQDLQDLQQKMGELGMYLMIDIVLNHTSHHHDWANRAKQGDAYYQDFFYMYDDRFIPDQFEQTMPEIFPEAAPGSFTYNKESGKWVMTIFHHYQWDLNFTNPDVLSAMLDNIFFYANLGVDILRIDAPAFIWKQLGTTCQNLPQAHTILRLIKQCVQVAAPGMALLGEAIVAPKEIINYFGTGSYTAKECDFAYNATHMALQWDALASGNIKVMMAAQHAILQKPFGATWITYTRCHDDIGLGYDDYMIANTGSDAYGHRRFLKEYYSGTFHGSPATGALFSVNPKTQDARISGTLASLCGLEHALKKASGHETELAIRRILLMQAHSFFLGGAPMIFYGDEVGYTNDYAYLDDAGKSYDNRWMHRPAINWNKNKNIEVPGTIEHRIFSSTQKLLSIRRKLDVVADLNNLTWLTPHNIHVAGYLRAWGDKRVYCMFNFNAHINYITWYAFKEHGMVPQKLFDHWEEKTWDVGEDHEYFVLQPYAFYILEPK